MKITFIALFILLSANIVSANLGLDTTDFSLPPIKQYECGQLIQTCGNCTFINITSVVHYPDGATQNFNAAMTMSSAGYYNYTFCNTNETGDFIYNTLGNPDGVLMSSPVKGKITSNGQDNNYNYLAASVFLIICAALVGGLVYYDRRGLDDEKYWNKIVSKYMEKNYVKFAITVVWYNFKKNAYVLYYLIGFAIMAILQDISAAYNLSILSLFEILIYIYAWSGAIVALVLIGNVQEWIKDWLNKLESIKWGGMFDGK